MSEVRWCAPGRMRPSSVVEQAGSPIDEQRIRAGGWPVRPAGIGIDPVGSPPSSPPATTRDQRVPSDTRTVAHSALWNLLGRAGPILIALAVTPHLVEALGPSRWGVFTIALSLVGIFGIFDFGVGRALTRLVAERVSAGHDRDAAALVVTSLVLLTILGVFGMLVLASLAGTWVGGALRVPPGLRTEILESIYVLCLSAPLVILNAALWGVIAAYQKFKAGNLINIPILALYYVGPLLILQVWNSLVGVMLVLVVCRFAVTTACLCVCLRTMPELRQARPSWRDLRPLLRLGGWMTVSTITWPVLTYMDRFVIAGVLSAAQTGFYATPFDLVTRFSILTIAINTSVFPAMAASFRADADHTSALFRRSVAAITCVLFPACLVTVGFSHALLSLWLGAPFAAQAAPVLQWLGIGIMVSSIDGVAANLIDAIGRPALNAKLSLAELAISVPLLVVLLHRFGIEGAAVAWAIRCLVDLFVRLQLARRAYPAIAPTIRSLTPTMVASIGLLFVPLVVPDITARCVTVAALAVIHLGVTLRFSCTADERRQLGRRSSLLRSRARLAVADPL